MEYIINLLIGVIGSLIAAYLFLNYTKKKDAKTEEVRYSASAGKYIGYGPDGNTIDETKPISNAIIEYIGGNQLKLTLTEKNDPHEWIGIISLESNNYGTIVWRYDKLHGKKVDPKEHRFGLKKFAFLPWEGRKVAYLMGDIKAGYFNEILMEAK